MKKTLILIVILILTIYTFGFKIGFELMTFMPCILLENQLTDNIYIEGGLGIYDKGYFFAGSGFNYSLYRDEPLFLFFQTGIKITDLHDQFFGYQKGFGFETNAKASVYFNLPNKIALGLTTGLGANLIKYNFSNIDFVIEPDLYFGINFIF